ncbi:uncharacterized protein LY79DRAFT_221104 [Colletotrichum navitas]|uniref:Uncharacterized protein n=1 Tax=Colletotrichum navitas TaxID=681940 RepID=A0AAD8PZ23_9PEZI|nr:uncharacterized protein LY79DRAFT_221104 [Colletotrichum navitas]KAK1590302.1 hypothetical protein LY79DRAFT_221104 [Colletotrichum navitas]
MPVNIYRQLQQAEPAASSDGTEPSPQSHQQGAAAGRREQTLAETSSAIMSKVAVLTSSTHELGVTIRQRSDLLALLGPTFTLAVRFQRLVAVASWLLLVYGHLLATTTLSSTIIATRLFAANSFLLLNATASALRRSLRRAWNSKNVTKLRKKFFMEFATTILGPGCNMLIVLVFWPGWMLVLGLLLAVRMIAG